MSTTETTACTNAPLDTSATRACPEFLPADAHEFVEEVLQIIGTKNASREYVQELFDMMPCLIERYRQIRKTELPDGLDLWAHEFDLALEKVKLVLDQLPFQVKSAALNDDEPNRPLHEILLDRLPSKITAAAAARGLYNNDNKSNGHTSGTPFHEYTILLMLADVLEKGARDLKEKAVPRFRPASFEKRLAARIALQASFSSGHTPTMSESGAYRRLADLFLKALAKLAPDEIADSNMETECHAVMREFGVSLERFHAQLML